MSRDGTISGMVLRPDKPALDPKGKPIGKYVWFTSSTCRGGGPGAVRSAHVPPIATDQAVELVRLTEGPLKAHIATVKSGLLTIGVPGLAWPLALPVLESLKTRTVRLAFDQDASVNRTVAGALAMACRGLVAEGYKLEVERWPAEHKGIDDALVAGVTPEVLTGLDAVRHALDQVRRLDRDRPVHVELDQVLAWVRWYLLDRNEPEALFVDDELLDGMTRLKDREPTEFKAVEALLRKRKQWTEFNRSIKHKASEQKKATRAARTAAVAPDMRPRIEITFDEHLVVDQALDAIKHDSALYQRGNVLAMVTKASSAGKQKGVVERPDGSVQIQTMPKPILRRIMSTHAQWGQVRETDDGKKFFARDRIPGWAVDQLWDLKRWPGVRHLEGVIEAPTMRPDGSLLVTPGYDDETGLLYLPSGAFP
jgi:hypothetical protein